MKTLFKVILVLTLVFNVVPATARSMSPLAKRYLKIAAGIATSILVAGGAAVGITAGVDPDIFSHDSHDGGDLGHLPGGDGSDVSGDSLSVTDVSLSSSTGLATFTFSDGDIMTMDMTGSHYTLNGESIALPDLMNTPNWIAFMAYADAHPA